MVEIGLCRTLERLGVRPDMTAGHSYGEYVALAAAGVISDSALFDLSESRGRAIKDTTHDEAGTMAAVSADAETITKALDGMEGITLANHNSPRQTVISGANAAVRRGHSEAGGGRAGGAADPGGLRFPLAADGTGARAIRRGAGAADVRQAVRGGFLEHAGRPSIRKIPRKSRRCSPATWCVR